MTTLQRVPVFQGDRWRDPGSALWQSTVGLLHTFCSILGDGDLPQNIQSTAGLAVILLTKTMWDQPDGVPELVSGLLLHKVDRAEQDRAEVPVWFRSSCGSLCLGPIPDPVLLFLCQGALAMLDWKGGQLGPGGDQLLLDIARVLSALSSRVKEPSLEASLSRILVSWTNSALELLSAGSLGLRASLAGTSPTAGPLLDYVFAHWDHPLDAVRHQARLVFRNLLRLHQLSQATPTSTLATDATPSSAPDASATPPPSPAVPNDPFLAGLTGHLLSLEWHVQGKFAALRCLAECIGAAGLLALAPTLPSQVLAVMGDQALAPHASDLLEALFLSHRASLQHEHPGAEAWVGPWLTTWVSPLLSVLCEGDLAQTTHITDYYLPKLLRCSPAGLGHMVDVLQASVRAGHGRGRGGRGPLGALMACLRSARAHGHLQASTLGPWSHLVTSGWIKQGLVHQHGQVRIDALGLLCECHRSTELVTAEEMQLIHFFLRYNLNVQSPGLRQQICSFLGKLFCRIRESSQGLFRLAQNKARAGPAPESAQGNPDPRLAQEEPTEALQRYQGFLSSVCSRLFEALFPGSSHATRFSALTILSSLAEMFPASDGDAPVVFQLAKEINPKRVQTLLECFASTFEEVKTLAFDLLMKFPKTVVDLQEPAQLQVLFQAAMELSTSTKPYDCVTASYLLNFLVHQEALLPAMCPPLPAPPGLPQDHQGSLAGTMEHNSLAVAGHLLDELEGDISRAEESLLQAAALAPMYGRVHCLTGILQQVAPSSVTLLDAWKPVVARLLVAAYRLSAVVAPVVQSSSPEGLVPMDTDADAAARLWMILSEIQPRDTNDYFHQAKLLGGQRGPQTEGRSPDPPGNAPLDAAGPESTACDVTAQTVLVCCWRSMKEVALLLGLLCQLHPGPCGPGSPDTLVTVQQVKEIGEYFRQPLLQARHRGAFELAYTGFGKLTEVLARCHHDSLHLLPEKWLRAVLEEIKSSDASSKLCATRRSAGIPFYIQALLAPGHKTGRMDLLKVAMQELISLAEPQPQPQSTVPQVHALNILRALFRDARLGESVGPYVAAGVRAAILGFTSPVWAVRNSSTLLFGSLMTRIFGVKRGKDEHSKKNRMTGREFFSRFPALYPFLLEKLQAAASAMDRASGELQLHPSLFLLLLVLSRLYPSPMDNAATPTATLSLAPFIPVIRRCGRSPIYRSRELAARALVPFVLTDQVPATVRSLLDELPDRTHVPVRQNHIHGVLLQILHLLRSCSESQHGPSPDLRRALPDLADRARGKQWLGQRHNPCLVTRATFVDILTLLTSCLRRSCPSSHLVSELAGFREALDTVVSDSELVTQGLPGTAIPGLPQYLQSVARLALILPPPSDSATTVQLLRSELPDLRLLGLEALLPQEGPRVPVEAAEALLRAALKETHPQCLSKALQALHSLDLESWLPVAAHSLHLTAAQLWTWAMDIADTSGDRVGVQTAAFKLASALFLHLVQHESGEPRPGMGASVRERWVRLVTQCCRDDGQTEAKLVAADVLLSAAPSCLASQNLILGLPATLTLWRCVLTLLQSEEQVVREAAAQVVRVALAQEHICKTSELAFCSLTAAVALDVAIELLCELLLWWNQAAAGVPVLLGWLLGDSETGPDAETSLQQEEEGILFDKGTANFWAETLTFSEHLGRHLSTLVAAVPAQDLAHLHGLRAAAAAQAQAVSRLLQALPPVPTFSRTAESTQLRIQAERAEGCLHVLSLVGRT
ncbi:thyroid adenoma-associated protein [Tachyglossus aculeatus]|uniref:thyroid adenoma-associated protein n=1 Tax=Tachyglossus aculeatus TaxID=9261 RepID=UPI0018F656D4|nr:thyroid adenoma-associated protein [Tachyglossus aculeatus]